MAGTLIIQQTDTPTAPSAGQSALSFPATGNSLKWVDGDAASYTTTITNSATAAVELTIPATGTAALLGTENAFTATQTVSGSDGTFTVGAAAPGVFIDAFSTNSSMFFLHNQKTGSSGPQFVIRRSRPSGVTTANNDVLANWFFQGSYDGGTNFVTGVQLRATATGAYSVSSSPAKFEILTTPSGSTTAVERFTILSSGYVMIGTSTSGGQLTIDQPAAGANIPVLYLDQGDSDEPFIQYVGTSSAANANNSITEWKTGAVLTGYIRQNVNGTDYWVPYYTAPTGA